MKQVNILKKISTTYFIQSIITSIVSVVLGYYLVTYFGFMDIETISVVLDSIFKMVVVIIGTLWSLNRYYSQRIDEIRLEIDAYVKKIGIKEGENNNPSERSFLVYWINLKNMGTTQIPQCEKILEIDVLGNDETDVVYDLVHRWPKEGTHLSGPIEPGSWSAINDAIIISSSVHAVRIFLRVIIPGESDWTWHKTFPLIECVP